MTQVNSYINSLPRYDEKKVDAFFTEAAKHMPHKIISLDDDPTGVQTVHGVPVYTDWEESTIREAFEDERQLIFILTNSRSFSEAETTKVHTDIAERIARVSEEKNQPFLLISRGDSTLRGHYPLETEVLKDTLESRTGQAVEGEILIPFFEQGNRRTAFDVHYIQQGETFVPVAETEFARDRMFGFASSHLGEYVEEKTGGRFKREDVISISLDELRALDFEAIGSKLGQAASFQKVIVNAVSETDVKVFCIALFRAVNNSKNFLFRTAATFTKEIGGITRKPYLDAGSLFKHQSDHGGLIIIGSHVQKSTEQLEVLKQLTDIQFVEFYCSAVMGEEAFQKETHRVQQIVDSFIEQGTTVCVYTSRERIDLGENRKEEELALSVKISNAVTSFVKNAACQPAFVVAKGGITSSDVGTKGLFVKKAEVLGQIAPGVPVWQTDEKSRFPGIPYVIFPGNVGERETLQRVVQTLQKHI
ncbi:four-carbon acid sugar kinase family protein [Marinococcus luteus]|uniref:four-carbon acid sugar kinase family protein n=1 Tax=Marinococcus luteus TaxID=1122204 RepID=UPI002ACC7E60|nr:four-carbon acid sugar kinase family protein [Marinococcus luteus]MDZ5784299.1 four-carbon acid sugar kinase family protein [Marinococcus luteus]